MKISIVTGVFPPESPASAVTAASVADELVRRGHRVSVFAPFPNRPSGRLMPGWRMAWRHERERNGYSVVHSWHTLSTSSTFASRFLENVSFGATSTLQMLCEERPDVVYMNTWPIFAQNMTSWALTRRGVPVVARAADVYPETLIGKNMIRADSILARTMLRFDNAHMRRCARIITLSDAMRDHLVSARGLAPDKVHCIPEWRDADVFPVCDDVNNAFRREHGIAPSTFVAMFAGALTLSAGPALYVQVARLLREHRNILILLVGDGSERPKLEAEIRRAGLDNVRIIFPLTPEQVPEVQGAANVLLLSLTGDMSESAAPSKQVSYLLSGRATIASVTPKSSAARIVSESKGGYVLSPDAPEPVAELLLRLANDPSPLATMGSNARAYGEAHFSSRAVLPKVMELLESVAGERRQGGRSKG
jgi:colanic acid biosynthesis glycosyl transferase WcaI